MVFPIVLDWSRVNINPLALAIGTLQSYRYFYFDLEFQEQTNILPIYRGYPGLSGNAQYSLFLTDLQPCLTLNALYGTIICDFLKSLRHQSDRTGMGSSILRILCCPLNLGGDHFMRLQVILCRLQINDAVGYRHQTE